MKTQTPTQKLVKRLIEMGGGAIRDVGVFQNGNGRGNRFIVISEADAAELADMLEATWCICGAASTDPTSSCPDCPAGPTPKKQRTRVWKRSGK